jgi:putative membrane protein
MKIVPIARAEFSRLTSSALGKLSLAAILIVPVVYGGLYLWGNEDPYENLDGIPAAIVVQDSGARVDGAVVNYGQDAADELLDDGTFEWHDVTAKAAASGVEDGTYNFAVTFPAEFSSDLASASGDEPQQAQLVLTTNDTNGYLSTTLAEQAAATIRTTIASNVGEEATTELLTAVADIRDGVVDAADGSNRLADGTADAAAGAQSLASGSTDLAAGADELSAGTDSVAEGAAELAEANSSVATGAKKLSGALATMDDEVQGLPESTSALDSGAHSVADGASELATAAPEVQAQVATVMAAYGVPIATSAAIDSALQGISSGAETLSTGADQLAKGTQQLDSSSEQLASVVHSAATGARSLASGAKEARNGARELADGADSAATGASELENGANALASGATDLAAGTDELADGASTLNESMASALGDIPEMTADDRAATATAVGDPLAVDQNAMTDAGNYGAGIAPFFISLSAWIGIYALFLLVRPLSRRALTAVRKPVRTTLAGWLTPSVLGAVQMLVLFAVVAFVLKLPIENAPGLLGFMVFVSITFAAIVLALNVVLGSVGQFLALILMILQLVVAGGTFPWQTLPAPLASLHFVLPMGHAVDGIRQFMYGGTSDAVGAAVWPLGVWLVASLVIAGLGAAKQSRFRTMRELRPSAIGG